MKTVQANLGKHLDKLEWIHRHCFPSDEIPDWSVGTWWIMWEDKKPIAFIGLEPVKSWKEAVYISRVGVISEKEEKVYRFF